jgi:hypothetical protein
MDTTTPDEGAVTAQPTQTPEAVTQEADAGIPIVTDENGTPALADSTSQASASEAVSEAPKEQTETQAADKTDDEIVAWSEKKGLKINPENPNEVKLARMQLEAERKMHEARQIQSPVQPPEELPLSGEDVNYDAVVERLNRQEQINYVKNWFDANPTASEHKEALREIAETRPWLTNLDDVYAHFLADPSQQAKVKQEGGVEALTNLAQKQQAIPPNAASTNASSFESQTITPQNVYDLVDKNDQAWFEKHHAEISRAMSGK